MAEKAGWGDLIHDAVVSFLLLRDFFGYLFAGAVLVFLAVASGLLDLGVNHLGRWPVWVAFSYVCGHLGAAVGYWIQEGAAAIIKRPKPKPEPTARALYFKRLYPSLFVEVDRRETLALLRTAVGGSLFVAAWLFLPRLAVAAPLALSVVFLISGFAAREHVRKYLDATLDAATWAAKADGLDLPPA